DDRPRLHERGRHVEDGRAKPLLKVEVVLAREVRIHLHHLRAHNLEPSVLKPLEDAASESAGYRVRLQQNKSPLYSNHAMLQISVECLQDTLRLWAKFSCIATSPKNGARTQTSVLDGRVCRTNLGLQCTKQNVPQI